MQHARRKHNCGGGNDPAYGYPRNHELLVLDAPCAVRLSDELNCYSAKLAEIGVQRIALAREYDARE